jgi:hypothetical protein
MNAVVPRQTGGAVVERHLEHIGQYPITEIRITIERLAEVLGEKEEKGGFLRLYHDSNGNYLDEVFVDVFGFFKEPKKNRPIFEKFSEEKAKRLHKHHIHRSSYESRDEKKECFGGAIKTKNGFIISISGMSEAEDEALALCLAIHLCWMEEKEAAKIASKKSLTILKRLIKAMKK